MLTDTEARALLHQAADTIEVGHAAPFAPPPRRRVAPLVLAAAAAVLLVVAGLAAWRATEPGPADHTDQRVRVPSVFGHTVHSAESLLAHVGLRPLVVIVVTCKTTGGRSISTDPPAGTLVPHGGRITLTVAVHPDGGCLGEITRDQADAWRLIDLATGRGAGPGFASYLEMGVTHGQSVTVPADPRTGPRQWLPCPAADVGCPGTVLDVLANAVGGMTPRAGVTVVPHLVVADNPRPWPAGFTGARSVRFFVAAPGKSAGHPVWSVDAFYDAQHRLTGVYLHWGHRHSRVR